MQIPSNESLHRMEFPCNMVIIHYAQYCNMPPKDTLQLNFAGAYFLDNNPRGHLPFVYHFHPSLTSPHSISTSSSSSTTTTTTPAARPAVSSSSSSSHGGHASQDSRQRRDDGDVFVVGVVLVQFLLKVVVEGSDGDAAAAAHRPVSVAPDGVRVVGGFRQFFVLEGRVSDDRLADGTPIAMVFRRRSVGAL